MKGMILMIDYSETGISSEKTSDDYLALNSCGIEYLSERDRGSMRRSGRVDYHILYIERGICRLQTHDNPCPGGNSEPEITEVGAGGIIMFRPGEPQIYSFLAKDDSVSHYIHFTGRGAGELLRKLGIYEIRVFDMGESLRYREISAEMTREYTMKKPFYETFCVSKLTGLLGIIARKYSLRHNRVGHTGESRINAACRRIYENLASPPTTDELASEACLSVSRFTHLFREATGRPVGDFILSMRIERAKELLVSELPVGEVARMVGFEDQNYFSRVFRAKVGVPPRTFRKIELGDGF